MNNIEPDFTRQSRPSRRDVMFRMRVEGFVPTWDVPADPYADCAGTGDQTIPF